MNMNRAVRVRGPNYDRLLVGKKLTDARIAYYAARGRYGSDYKQQQAARTKRKSRNVLADIMKEFA